MSKITIHNPNVSLSFVSSLMAFSQNAKFEISPEGVRVGLLCDSPNRMRIEYKSNVMSSDSNVSLCLKDIQRLHKAISLVVDACGDIEPIILTTQDKDGNVESVGYQRDRLAFRIGAIMERAIMASIDNRTFGDIQSTFSVTIPMEKLKYMFKQVAIVKSNDCKIYLVQNSDGSIGGQIEDKDNKFCGMVSVPLAEKAEGIFESIVLSTNSMKSMTKLPGDTMKLDYMQSGGVMMSASMHIGNYFISAKTAFATMGE